MADVTPESSMSGGEHCRVVAAGPTLAYEIVTSRDVSSSLTLFCLHGNSSHRGIWRPVTERLQGYRSVLLDLRGFGDSDHVSPPGYNPEHHAADIAAVVSGGFISPPYAILAHSAGALAATHFIASAAVSSITLPEAFVWVDLDPLVPRWQVDYFHQGVSSVSRVFATIDDAARPFRRIYPKIPEDRLQAFVIEGLRSVEGGFRLKLDPATYGTWEPGDLRPLLPAVLRPTLVLRESESIVTSGDGMSALTRGLSDHEFHELEGGTHMLLLEEPERAADVIGDFLDRRAFRPAN